MRAIPVYWRLHAVVSVGGPILYHMSSSTIPGQRSLLGPPPPPSEAQANYGEVFTRPWIVDLILDLVGFVESKDLYALRLVEPACGSGAFLLPAVERILASWVRAGSPVGGLEDCVEAYDLQEHNVRSARKSVEKLLSAAGVAGGDAQRIAQKWVIHQDFLLIDSPYEGADFVIGNPPYIRPEEVDPQRMALYRSACHTMTGRSDVYVGFFEKGLDRLNSEGVLGFICADRWMRNAYGKGLRRLITRKYSVDVSLEMHDVDAFEESVSAYPAVSVISKRMQGAPLVGTATEVFGQSAAVEVVDWSAAHRRPGQSAAISDGTKLARLEGWFDGGGASWPAGSPEALAVLKDLETRFQPLERASTKVGIGVATGADGVFVTPDSSVAEEDRMIPLSMTRDTKSGVVEWSGNYLVNPWKGPGVLVDLNSYPRLRSYLETHSEVLRGRHVASRRPDQWYRTIDPVHLDLIVKPKLLFPDLKMTSHPVLEREGLYPHHNLYYVVSDDWDMEVLGGILLSRVAQFFVESYAVRMRGGTLRFQAQYLRRIRTPDPDQITNSQSVSLRTAFRKRDVALATSTALAVYGLSGLPD